MILSHPTFSNMLSIEEGKITVLAVENPSQFASYLQELNSQIGGADGQFALFDKRESLPLSSIKLILDPFNLDMNSKEIQNGVVAKIKATMNSEKHYLRMQELISKIDSFSFDILSEVDTELVSSEIDQIGLTKLFSPHFINGSDSVLENICQYIRISTQFTKTLIFAFVNLKTFLNEKELELFFKQMLYIKVQILLFESTPYPHSDVINETIIDSDLCEISGKSIVP